MADLWTRERPLVWSEAELERDRQIAIGNFIQRRLAEGTTPYVERFRRLHRIIQRLFAETSDLRSLNGRVFVEHPSLVQPARFISGPPVSQDDLKTLLQKNPFRKKIGLTEANEVAAVLLRLADPLRFPWLRRERAPRPEERRLAVRWTTSLWCVEQIRTGRRMESSAEQQDAVAACLREVSLEYMKSRQINALEDLPIGSYTSEVMLASVKCDVPVRLFNRRLLAIECKVSNSGVNSIKRLNREVGNKAEAWRREFGQQVFPAAVLDGVFELVNLRHAQAHGITIFWAHDLSKLADVVNATRL